MITAHQPSTFRTALILLTVTLLASPGFGAERESSFQVASTDGKPQDWTAARLKEQFAADIHPVEYTSKGEKHTAHCIALLTLLHSAGVQTDFKMDPKADSKIKNFPLRLAIVVEGRDGYVAAFSLGELLPTIGNREAWLALDIDGKPLSEQEEPVKLIVPSDQKPSRWVRGIAFIRAINVSTAGRR